MAVAKPIKDVDTRQRMIFPKIDDKPKIEMANILYKKPVSEVRKVSKALAGHRGLTYTEVGRRTFEYYMDNEVTE